METIQSQRNFARLFELNLFNLQCILFENSDYSNKDVKAETDDFFNTNKIPIKSNTNKIWNLYIVREFQTNIHVF